MKKYNMKNIDGFELFTEGRRKSKVDHSNDELKRPPQPGDTVLAKRPGQASRYAVVTDTGRPRPGFPSGSLGLSWEYNRTWVGTDQVMVLKGNLSDYVLFHRPESKKEYDVMQDELRRGKTYDELVQKYRSTGRYR